jgi:transcriptional regulator with GAF, ATPase, and Fis domain
VGHREREEEEELSTELRPTDDAAGSTTAPAFELVVVDGPDAGARFSLDAAAPARVLVGQSPACTVRLTDRRVSRRHAAFQFTEGPSVELCDLGSRNGTFVNRVRIAAAYLRGGETIGLGDSTLRLELVEPARRVPLSKASAFGRVVGASVEMRRLYPLLEKLAASDVPVVVEGETGTGKELVAEALHAEGRRADKPFVVFDCTTVAPNLVESELFGHERGAFTGALAARKGVFELADGGTLFIDEIGDLDLSLQPKLLRAIQRSEVRRVGGDRWVPVEVRVIAATRRDLDQEVQEGRFREDLFFRLVVARIELPPLRSRKGDVTLLAHHFWKELGGTGTVPYDLVQRCEAYAWPGNVRELYNEVARRIALGDLDEVARGRSASSAQEKDFLGSVLALDLPISRAREKLLDEFHRRYVERVIAQHGGNITRAAAASGLALRYFQVLRAKQSKG